MMMQISRKYTVSSLRAKGFETIAAMNGEDGLALIRSQHPDIVLLDLQMPVKDGIEVLEALKRDPALSRIPVVVE
jgi:CheY-like chemotaxis protein